jgi:hypothetical protein
MSDDEKGRDSIDRLVDSFEKFFERDKVTASPYLTAAYKSILNAQNYCNLCKKIGEENSTRIKGKAKINPRGFLARILTENEMDLEGKIISKKNDYQVKALEEASNAIAQLTSYGPRNIEANEAFNELTIHIGRWIKERSETPEKLEEKLSEYFIRALTEGKKISDTERDTLRAMIQETPFTVKLLGALLPVFEVLDEPIENGIKFLRDNDVLSKVSPHIKNLIDVCKKEPTDRYIRKIEEFRKKCISTIGSSEKCNGADKDLKSAEADIKRMINNENFFYARGAQMLAVTLMPVYGVIEGIKKDLAQGLDLDKIEESLDKIGRKGRRFSLF